MFQTSKLSSLQVNKLINLSQSEASVVWSCLRKSQNLLLFETFIKTACTRKHIAALNNAIHHVEHHHCSYANMTIMQLIIVFNGDNNHFLHFYTLLLHLLAVKKQN